jgi:hypothetical protein
MGILPRVYGPAVQTEHLSLPPPARKTPARRMSRAAAEPGGTTGAVRRAAAVPALSGA